MSPTLKPKPNPKAKIKANDVDMAPDVERGDEIYFRTPRGPSTGKVLARGKHGVTLDHKGARVSCRWDDIHGHKTKVRPNVKVVDQGDDGMIVEDEHGQRRFVRDPLNPEPEMTKAIHPVVLLFGKSEEFSKAIKNGPGLSLVNVTDKRGHQTKRWKRHGDPVTFKHPVHGQESQGHIHGTPGRDGAHVKDAATGEVHQVENEHIKDRNESAGSGGDGGGGGPVGRDGGGESGEEFNAEAYGQSTDDPDVTPEKILALFPPETAQIIERTEAKLKDLRKTIDLHKNGAEWLQQRRDLHDKILFSGFTDSKGKVHEGLLSPERVAKAKPKSGQKPTFTVLGGRGGSGKSWFNGKVYEEGNAIVLDADEIKGMLPEYQGWNADQVHEESGELFDDVTRIARNLGLNVVHDATMKNGAKAVDLVKSFKEAGYRVEAHYMHLPRQEAAKRAVGRFLTDKNDGSGRYVPTKVVLGMQTNEKSFDQVRPHVDKWSFRDNNVARGEQPKLIAEGGSEKP